MNAGKTQACSPTWQGHVETTKDALLIFEACFAGTLAHCFRRPHDRERSQLIVSGNVFVYEEATSGIKRWTDGIPWSPSRILTNFLIYRQLNSPFPPGEKKRATKRSQRMPKSGEPYPTPTSSTTTSDEYTSSFSPESPGLKSDEGVDKDGDRGLVGSLVDSYEFKEKGLLKKTMTVSIKGVQHHLVSYYSLEDAKHKLKTPRDDPRLKDLLLRPDLLHQSKFKFSNLDDAGDGTFEQLDPPQPRYPYLPNGYDQMRQFAAPNHGHGHFQESPSQYYVNNIHSYITPVQTPTAQHYGSTPTTSTTYTPTASPSTTYPSHQGHGLGSHYSLQQPQSTVHPPHQQQQHPQYQLTHHQVTSPRDHQEQSSAFQHQYPPSSTLPKPNAMYLNSNHLPDTNGLHNGIYDSYTSGAPINQTMVQYHGIPQMPPAYMNSQNPYVGRSDGAIQQPHRAC